MTYLFYSYLYTADMFFPRTTDRGSTFFGVTSDYYCFGDKEEDISYPSVWGTNSWEVRNAWKSQALDKIGKRFPKTRRYFGCSTKLASQY